MKIEDRIRRSIQQRAGNVVLRSDFAAMGSPSQISEALKALQAKQVIVRVGTGVYAKTRKSSVTGAIVPAGSLETLAPEVFQKLGVLVTAGAAAQAYNAGQTTQLPGAFVAYTGKRRIRRSISVGGRKVIYENDYGRAKASA
jgi:hypothetical protein